MNLVLQSYRTRATKTLRALVGAATLALGLATVTSTAHATRRPQALPSLTGLMEVDFGDSIRDRLVKAGLDAIGTPYSWGGDDPNDGFDCSGLVSFVYREIANLDLPRSAREQRTEGTTVDRRKLQPGDLVFFATTNRRNAISHVGLYIGDNQFVHAPRRGTKVRIDKLDDSYWSKRFRGARAYVEPTVPSGPPQLIALQELN